MPAESAPERRLVAQRLLREASLELARLRRVRGAYRTTSRRVARARKRLAFAAALLAAPGPADALTPFFQHGFMVIPTGAGTTLDAPAFADVDGDGDVDLFIGLQSGNVLFFENTGTTTHPVFAAALTNPFGLSDVGTYAIPAFADLDGDGDLDALARAPVGTLYFENTGTATTPAFAPPLANVFGLTGAAFELADVDADGDLDAFGWTTTGAVSFRENTGTASTPAFGAPVTDPFGLTGSGLDVDFADVDGDGDLDAFRGDGYDRTILLHRNTGTTTAPAFAAPVNDPYGLIGWGYSFADFADVDGDGDLDALLTGHFYESVRVTAFENIGTASAPHFTPLGNPFGFGEVVSYFAVSTVAFADLDGDGDLDAFVSESYQYAISSHQNAETASAPAFAPPASALPLRGVRPGFVDIDADGDLDAFAGHADDTAFFRNTGSASSPSFAPFLTNPFGLTDVAAIRYASPSFTDIDGDGDFDAMVGDQLGDVSFFANTGSASAPAFAAPSTNPFGLADVGYHAAPTFADVDGDGDVDGWIGNSQGNTLWFDNTGTALAPAFAAPATNPFGLQNVRGRAAPTFADIDDDGDLDAFVGASDARVYFFENVALDPDACRDGLDNDGDGRIDTGSDAGCTNSFDTSELSTLQCDNGLDDDADGKIDWRGDGSGDPHCSGLLDDRELPAPAGPGCGLGPELLLLVPLLEAERRRRTARSLLVISRGGPHRARGLP